MRTRRAAEHYVNNAEFSQAVVDYVKKLNEAEASGEPLPVIPDYIADCFMRICEGLSHRPNFIRYTYREEMVMDAVENCLKAISNYDIDAPTRTGKPNAFAYFTQISWWAFLRRIEKEKKQQEIKMKYMTSAGIDMFAVTNDAASTQAVVNYVDTLRSRIDTVKDKDSALKEFAAEEKKREKIKNVKLADSNLGDFLDDD